MTGAIIREARIEDIDALLEVVNQPTNRHGTGRVPFQTRSWVEARIPPTDPNITCVVAVVEGTAIGWATLARGKERRTHVGSIGIAVHEAHVGKGYGRQMMNALLDVADNWMGLVRVQLDVNCDNAPAIALYKNCGFEIEGVQRAHVIRDGQYIDGYLMSRIRPAAEHVPFAQEASND